MPSDKMNNEPMEPLELIVSGSNFRITCGNCSHVFDVEAPSEPTEMEPIEIPKYTCPNCLVINTLTVFSGMVNELQENRVLMRNIRNG